MEVFMNYRAAGITLIEILVVLSLLVFLLFKLSTMDFSTSKTNNIVDNYMETLLRAVSMARQIAISENRMVTFCRSNDGQHCQGQWVDGSIIFTDRNADSLVNGDDRIVFRLDPFMTDGNLKFSSFRNRQYVQLTPLGTTNYQNGNFTYCPVNGDPHLVRQMVISLSGRSRMASDNDNDGIVENSQGKPLNCN